MKSQYVNRYYTTKRGVELAIKMPAMFAVCHGCLGQGKVENPSFSGGFTLNEFDECFSHSEDRARYFSGEYDVTCPACEGERVMLVVDEDRLTRRQATKLAMIHAQEEHMEDEAWACEQEMRAERRMGC